MLMKRRADLVAKMRDMVVPSIVEVKRRKEFKRRKFEPRPKYEFSTWGMMLAHPRFKYPHDRKGGQNYSEDDLECHFQFTWKFLG